MRKSFPRTHAALVKEGFGYIAAGTCSDCGAGIFWYRTPLGKRLPVDARRNLPHFWICGARRNKSSPAPRQLDLFEAGGGVKSSGRAPA